MTSNSDVASTEKEQGEPSLGPACLMIVIISLAGLTAFCGIGSWFVFANQPALAKKAIEKTLVPWIEGSRLAPSDKESIVAQLDTIVTRLDNNEITKQQLTRLRNCLQDNPVLLWGEIQSIEAQASQAGLTETEIETLKRTNQRLLRMTTDRQLGRNDLEFTIQKLSEVNKQGDSLQVRSGLTADEIRQYISRAENLFTRSKLPNMSFDKTPAEAFEMLIKAALEVPTEKK